jgi:hypothetical protein
MMGRGKPPNALKGKRGRERRRKIRKGRHLELQSQECILSVIIWFSVVK